MMSLREAAMVLGSVASADASARFLHISIDSWNCYPGRCLSLCADRTMMVMNIWGQWPPPVLVVR